MTIYFDSRSKARTYKGQKSATIVDRGAGVDRRWGVRYQR